MSGQPSRNFDPTPGRFSDVGNTADAPSVRTDLYRPTAAQRTSDAQPLEAIGSALGAFFNAGQQALQHVDAVNHQQDLIQIERENQALQKQAVADQELGKPQDPRYADRHAYAGTYQTSAADAHAFDLSQALRDLMAKQPLDGSVDLNKVARDYFKTQVGSGTGNPDYDARLLSQFSKSADQQIAQYSEAQRATVLQNSTNEVVQQFAQRVLSPEGITTPQFAEMRERIGNLVHGDTGLRDKIVMSAVAGSVQNDGQGQSVLRAMQELGLDRSEPEYFNRISGEVLKRTNAVKTYDAGLAVQKFQQEMTLEKSRYPLGVLPPERVAEYARRAFAIDSIHGVGMDKFPELTHEWNRGLAKAAGDNLWAASYSGQYGTQDSLFVASRFGKSPSTVLSEHYDSAMSQLASQQYPALAESRDGTGLVHPMKTEQSAQDYAQLILAGGATGGHRAASQDTISDTYKAEMGRSLLGKDAKAMARSYRFYDALSRGGLSDSQLHRYFPNDQAENMFWAMRSISGGPLGTEQIAQYLADRPHDADDFSQVGRTGKVDLAAFARKAGFAGQPQEIDKKITEARNAAMLDSAMRKKWFGNAPVAMDSNETAGFDSLLLQQFVVQKATSGSIDLDAAVKAVAGQKGKYIVVPGPFGALQAKRNPFPTTGYTMLHPLNEAPSHPLSISKGYAPIYLPGVQMVNALSKDEDLLVTWAEDADSAHKAFPGKIAEGEKLYLEGPNNAGLSAVRTASGEAIQFRPGEKVAFRTGLGSETLQFTTPEERDVPSLDKYKVLKRVVDKGFAELTVPLDPKEASEFFRKNLGPGWYVQRDGYLGPQGQGYTLYYGARLKVGEKERDQMIAERPGKLQAIREAGIRATQTTELPSGAAIRYTRATGTDGGRNPGGDALAQRGAAIRESVGWAAKVYTETAKQQVQLIEDLVSPLGIAERLDKVKGAFGGK